MSLALRLRCAQFVLVDPSALHHKRHVLQRLHALQRVGGHRNQVGVLAGFHRSHVFRAVDRVEQLEEVAARMAPAGVMPNLTM